MTKKNKSTLASLLFSLQLFFSFFAPFSPYLLTPQVFALSKLEATQKQSLLSFSYLDDKYDQLIVGVGDFYEQSLPYSMYYLNQGRTQAVVGNLITGMENAIFVGTQSGDHYLSHQWSRMIFKLKMTDGFWSYRLEKDIQNKITTSISRSETDALSEAELSWLTWHVDEKNQKAETIQNVVTNQDYHFPLDPKVSVKFTKLPEKTSPLSIQRLSLSKELADKYGADVAYQIETQMEDGSFELDLQLPVSENLPNTTSLEVISADNLDQLSQKNTDQLSTIDINDPSVKIDEDSSTIQVTFLDHLSVWVVAENKKVNTDKKVNICHATHSNPNNPYESIEVAIESIIKESGYSFQLGPIWFEGIKVHWGDIIPPIKNDTYLSSGYNWSEEGQAIWANNCEVGDGSNEDEPRCGDGVLDEGEECDYGSSNGQSSCSVSCVLTDVAEVTVCKNNSLNEPVSGWPVILRHDSPLEQVIVYPDGGVYSSHTLDSGDYLLVASGTYQYRGGTNLLSDPGYSERLESDGFTGPYFPWINVMKLNSVGALGIKINGQPTNWGEFNLEHRYAQAFSDYRGKFDFSVYDNQYADNKGSMKVDIYEGWLGQTQADGCYTFENVVVGDYTIEEMTRFGWSPLNPDSGSISTYIDKNREFFFVNQSIGSISGYKYHDFNA
ncbi:MAG TPA: hypothetical protein PLM16_02975, partial [Candidatus Woesebacteria bacterium]|nr:hypothetical protein [Candidatus Woesebacteria bacterium]